MMMIEFLVLEHNGQDSLTMTSDSSLLESFREDQYSALLEIFRQLTSHLRFHSSDYLWYLTIVISLLTFVLILSIICEWKSLFSDPSFAKYLFFRSATSFFLHELCNSPSFARQFTRRLNQNLFSRKQSFSVEAVHFTQARIRHVAEEKNEPTPKKLIIDGTLDLDHVIFNIVNAKQEQHYSVEMSQLTTRFQMGLIIAEARYAMEMQFNHVHFERPLIIDPNNNLSFDEKQSIIELLKETICQSIVPCSFQRTTDPSSPAIFTRSSSPSDLSPVEPPTPPTIVSPVTPPPVVVVEPLPAPPLAVVVEQIEPEKVIPKKLLVRVVKAVKLHDVEQPFCVLELNHPKQIHQTSIAKNGLNPFWDERFLFECDQTSNRIHLQIFDRRKASRKNHQQATDRIYADLSIPFSYVTSSSYKQDVRITPQYPDSIIRIEFSTLSDDDSLTDSDSDQWTFLDEDANGFDHDYLHSPSMEIVSLPYSRTVSTENHKADYPQSTGADAGLTTHPDDKPRKKKSLLRSLKHFTFGRRRREKSRSKTDQSGISSQNTTLQSSAIPNSSLHDVVTEPVLSSRGKESNTMPSSRSMTRSFRNLFRSKSKQTRQTINANNFVLDQHDPLTTSTPVSKKRSFFQRNKLKQQKNQTSHLSANSLTSYDCSRSESVRNTPIRANVGHPVTMPKSLVR